MTMRELDCPRCGGSGEIAHHGTSLNPYTSVRAFDPQLVVTEPCPRCHGTGVIVRSIPQRTSARRSGNDEPSSTARPAALPSDGRRAA